MLICQSEYIQQTGYCSVKEQCLMRTVTFDIGVRNPVFVCFVYTLLNSSYGAAYETTLEHLIPIKISRLTLIYLRIHTYLSA